MNKWYITVWYLQRYKSKNVVLSAEAFRLAKETRKHFETKYKYEFVQEGSETNSEIGLSIEDVPINDNIRKLMANSVGNINDKEVIVYY